VLIQALTRERDSAARGHLAQALAAIAGRLRPAEAAPLYAEAARVLTHALTQEKDPSQRWRLAEGLAVMAWGMGPDDAARVCAEAARMYRRALDDEDLAGEKWFFGLSVLVQQLDSEAATDAARALVRRLLSWPDMRSRSLSTVPSQFPDRIENCLTRVTRTEVQKRVRAAGATGPYPLASLCCLPVAAEPLPCRLATQDLVELLKFPTCVGEVRQIILRLLGNRYGRRFETHWDFVRYAQKQGLDLDFTTPPKRPDRKLPALFAE
jgi:hypothetical protein